MKNKGIVSVTALLLAVIMLVSFCSCRGERINDGMIGAPISARDAKGRNYEDIVTKFRLAGFENVYAEPMGDLIIGVLNKSGEVDEVTVGGKSDFRKDKRFSPDTYVIVKYHSFPNSTNSFEEEEESREPVIADTSDGMTALPVSSDEIRKLSVKEASSILSEAGFVNIKTEPLRDLIVEILHSDGDISEVSVGGDIEFKKGDRYQPDAAIVIRYHSY